MMTLKEKQQQKNGESLEGQPAHAWSPWCWFGGCGVSPPPQPWLRARQGSGSPGHSRGSLGHPWGPFQLLCLCLLTSSPSWGVRHEGWDVPAM